MNYDQQAFESATVDLYLFVFPMGQNQISGYSGVHQTLPVKQARVGIKKEPSEKISGRYHKESQLVQERAES